VAATVRRVASGGPIIRVTGVSKHFGGVQALTNVSISIMPGEVHAFVGENGAGKSTLAKIISGLVEPDGGEIIVDGEKVSFNSPRDALARGIATIAQELALVPGLTVAQNVYLGAEPRRWGFVRRRELAKRYATLAQETGFHLPGYLPTAALRTADAQKVEIMRAVSRDASVIIMDEPTAALSHDDTGRLHQIIRHLAATGRTVVLISHFLSEVLDLADTVSILRDGVLVRTGPASAETEASLIEAMLGRSLGSVFPPRQPPPAASVAPVLTVANLRASGVTGVSLTVRPGEIVGLAGLIGAGRTELAYALYGHARRTHGTITLDGRGHDPGSPRDALRSGMFLIPESRKDSGLILGQSVTENVTLSALARFARFGVIRAGRQRQATAELTERLSIRARLTSALWTLSGGNQQKVLFARGLLRTPRLLIADEPTRGVDVGSRRAIYDLIADQARAGLGVLVISSDFEELVGLAHRVLVMRGGRIVAELTGSRMTEHDILAAAFSEEQSTKDSTREGTR
jgi:simple sugar transport system ATP-binding protein/ribose transport system ATP-binding protein